MASQDPGFPWEEGSDASEVGGLSTSSLALWSPICPHFKENTVQTLFFTTPPTNPHLIPKADRGAAAQAGGKRHGTPAPSVCRTAPTPGQQGWWWPVLQGRASVGFSICPWRASPGILWSWLLGKAFRGHTSLSEVALGQRVPGLSLKPVALTACGVERTISTEQHYSPFNDVQAQLVTIRQGDELQPWVHTHVLPHLFWDFKYPRDLSRTQVEMNWTRKWACCKHGKKYTTLGHCGCTWLFTLLFEQQHLKIQF